MAYPGAATSAPAPFCPDGILPCRIELDVAGKGEDDPTISASLERLDENDLETKKALAELLNYEILVGGNSYPFEQEFSFAQAVEYYMSFDCFVLFDDEKRKQRGFAAEKQRQERMTLTVALDNGGAGKKERTFDFGPDVIGAVHIRPNFPGRSGHVANGAFLVAPHYRRIGAATVLGSFFPVLAKRLGYRVSLFNLVYEENAASIKLWNEKLHYPIVGRVPGAGRVVRRDRDGKVLGEVFSTAVMFSLQLDDATVIQVPAGDANLRQELKLSEIEVHVKKKEGAKFGEFLIKKQQ